MAYRLYRSIIAGIIIFSILLSFGCKEKVVVTEKIIIPDSRFMALLPLYIADEKGIFKKNNVNVEWSDVGTPSQALKVFLTGKADYVITTFAGSLPIESRQKNSIKLHLGVQETTSSPGSYFLVKQDSEIKSIVDIKGKKIGTYAGPTQRSYAIMVLRGMGLTENEDYQLIQVGSSAQIQSLFGGVFDVLFTVETHGTTAIQNGARVLETGVRTKYITNPFWVGSGVMHYDYYENNKDLVKRFSKSLQEAVNYINENDAEARKILSIKTNISDNIASNCYLYNWVVTMNENQLIEAQKTFDLLYVNNMIADSLEAENIFIKETID